MKLTLGKTYNRKLPLNFIETDRSIFEHELSITLTDLKAQLYNDVVVLSEQLIFYNRKRIHEIKTQAVDLGYLKTNIALIRRKPFFVQKAVYLTDMWSTNYYHWFTDVLPRLLLAEKEFPDHVFLIPSSFKNLEYVTASLQAFNKTTIEWIHNYQKAKVKELIYIPNTAPTGNYNEEILNFLSVKLRVYFKLDTIVPFKNIMISREKAANRKILNRDKILSALQNKNISEVVFEELTWPEQIKIAAQSKVLIGTHGAGLTNMIFMKPNSSVLELRRKDDDHNNCYFSMASALNINYYYVLNEVDDLKKTTQQNDFIVHYESLNNALDNIVTN